MKRSRKWIWIVGGVFAVLFVTMATLPFMVDVDQYRPKILEAAAPYINGKLELGKLKLSLWGRVRVEIAGLELRDSGNRQVVSVKDASFVMPFSSLLAGAPRFTLELEKPSLSVIRDAKGAFNVLGLVKLPEAATPAPQGASGQVALPAFVARSRLGVSILDARLVYQDEAKKTEVVVDHLRVNLKDASISSPTQLEVRAELDTKVADLVTLTGPVELSAETRPLVASGALQQMGLNLRAKATDLEIRMPGLFQKSRGIPAEIQAELALGTTEARISSARARFHNAELSITGSLMGLPTQPQVDLRLALAPLELKPWSELVPMLEAYKLSGKAGFEGKVNGPASAIQYSGLLKVDGVRFTHAKFKADPQVDGEVAVATERLEKIDFRLQAPGTELALRGKLTGFLKPQITAQITSSGMDLDQWLHLTTTQSKPGGSATSGESGAGSTHGEKPADFDAMLEPLRKNAIAAATTGAFSVDIRKMKVFQATLSDMRAKASLANLAMTLESASLQAFDGRVSSLAKLDLKPAHPAYSFSGKVEGLDIQKAVESQVSFLKNTLLGKLQAQVSGNGAGFNPAPAIQALQMKGSFEVRQARFASLDIAKIAAEGINGAIAKAAEKVPALKGRQLGSPGSREAAYEVIRSSFQMSGGKFSAPDFMAKSEPGKGIDLQGNLSVNLATQDLQMKGELIDTHNLTHAQDVSAEVAGVQIQRVLAEKGKPVRIPLTLGCKYTKPCPSYTELPEHFAKVALSNLSGAAQEKLKSEVKAKAGEVLKNVPLPSGLRKLFK